MTVKADSKKRVLVPGARPGDVFQYQDQGHGHFALERLTPSPLPKKKTRAQVLAAIRNSKLKFDMTWNELRTWTREP